MNIDVQRWVDRWVGIPLCAAVSAWDAITRSFKPAPQAQSAPRAIVIILLSEMGSLVLAHDMFARLKTRYPNAELHALLFGKNREILDLMRVIKPENVHAVDDKSLIGLLSSLWRSVVQLHSIWIVHANCHMDSAGRTNRGECRWNNHLMALSGIPGAAQGAE